MNTPIPEDNLAAIKTALFAGRKIEAIKLYREFTEAGLADAKNAVEKMEAELRAASPERFKASATAPPQRYRWPWFVLAAFLLAIALAILWMGYEVRRTRQIRDLNAPSPRGDTGRQPDKQFRVQSSEFRVPLSGLTFLQAPLRLM
jgi:hypothetical protein